jgi:hypothetical protein
MVFTYGGCRVRLGTHRDEIMRVLPHTLLPFVRANLLVTEGVNSVWVHHNGGAFT